MKPVLIVTLMFLCMTAIPAQNRLPGSGPFQTDVDVARFYGDSVQTYVELYYGIHEKALTYVMKEGKLSGAADMAWTIRRDTARIAHKEWVVTHSVNDTAEMRRGQTLIGLQSIGLPPGDYLMTIESRDANDPARSDSFSFPLKVTLYDSGKEGLSDIEFCSSIQSSTDRSSYFYKNTLNVIPNPGKLYGTGLPILYYYAEAYNLNRGNDQSKVTVKASVLDVSGREVTGNTRSKTRLHQSSVEVGTINLSAVRGGTYIFRLTLIDTAGRELALSAKKLFVYRLGSPVDSLQAAGEEVPMGEYSVMTEQEINTSFAHAKYIATPAEIKQFTSLTDLAGKRKFLFGFWQRRDPDPSTPYNEYKIEYEHRVELANQQFTVGTRDGWKSDRGRVLIMYGQPEEIDREPSTAATNPYETWQYHNIQGGVEFVFVDRQGLSDYQLVHSTHRDELRNDNWYSQYVAKLP